jgi:hypothetical protein
MVEPRQQPGSQKHTIEVIKPINETDGARHMKGDAIITIDGDLVAVKIRTRNKRWGKISDPLEGPGTWTVMRFDKPGIRKHPDYKAIWKEVFFALGLNINERGSLCEKRELQREWGSTDDVCDCKRCEERKSD